MFILLTILLVLVYAIAPGLAFDLFVIAVCVWAVSLAMAYLIFHAGVAVRIAAHDQRQGK